MQFIFNNYRNTLNAARHVIYFLIIVANIAQFSHRVFSARSNFSASGKRWKIACGHHTNCHLCVCFICMRVCACVCVCLVYIASKCTKIKWVFHICDYACRHTHTRTLFMFVYMSLLLWRTDSWLIALISSAQLVFACAVKKP